MAQLPARRLTATRRHRPAIIALLGTLTACARFDAASAPDAGSSVDPDGGVASDGSSGDGGDGGDGGTSSSYADTVLADAPVLYWRLSEGAGPFLDRSGKGRSGTLEGPAARGEPSLLARDPDPSLHVVKGSSVAAPAGVLDFSKLAPYSLECWLRVDEAPTGDMDVLTMSENGSDGIGLFFNSIGDLLTARGTQNHGGQVFAFGPTPHHVVATYDGTSLRLFVDGVPNDQTKTSTSLSSAAVGMWIGKTGNGTAKLDAWIDEVAVYAVALPSSRIEAHYAAGRP